MPAEDWTKQRRRLLDAIDDEVVTTSQHTGIRTLGSRVRQALDAVPRHRFVPAQCQDHAYEDRPLSIGKGQTISQPFIVALMTQLLDAGPDDTVLEIGTGSGYQAAVLAQLVRQVYSVEAIAELAQAAMAQLQALKLSNVEIRIGDGALGWPEYAPYDAIIVTAAAETVPPALIEQLRAGGRLVMPVGLEYGPQNLILIEKSPGGDLRQREVLPVAFVPLTTR